MYLAKQLTVRLTKKEYDKIVVIISNNKDKYDNISHFLRCSAIRLTTEEMNKL